MSVELNTIYTEDCLETMARMPNCFVDLTVTSPPYDGLRDYKDYSFDFENIAKELFRVTKDGGVVVWVVGDQTVDGDETGTSFKQALFFKEIGFKLWDTMIYYRPTPFPTSVRYTQTFEYMFVFSKGKAKTFNSVRVLRSDKSRRTINAYTGSTFRQKDGSVDYAKSNENRIKRLTLASSNELKNNDNVWYIPVGYNRSTQDSIAFKHPAIFPDKLAEDHILSWSNNGDIVYDPFSGSGTTAKMAKKNSRKYIGSEISAEYCQIAEERLASLNIITQDIFQENCLPL